MTSKEKVKSKYPSAYAKKFKISGIGNKSYWLIFDHFIGGNRLAEGKSESNAWKNAAENLTNK